jgi:hypothetical protein
VLDPTSIVGDAPKEVELESGLTVRGSTGLDEPFRIDPAVGVKMVLSCAVDAGNEVEQATVAL